MPNNWITAWFIASFQFGLCVCNVFVFLEIWTDVWFSIAYLWGEIPATEPNWKFFGRPEVLEPQPMVPHLFWRSSYFTSPLHNLCKIWGFQNFPRWPCDSRNCNVGEILGTRCPLLRLCPFTHRSRAGAFRLVPFCVRWLGEAGIGSTGGITQNPLAALGAFSWDW